MSPAFGVALSSARIGHRQVPFSTPKVATTTGSCRVMLLLAVDLTLNQRCSDLAKACGAARREMLDPGELC